MYIVAIAWIFVVLLMAVTEAVHPAGSVWGGIFTFLGYGVFPVALLTYILGAGQRWRKSHPQRRSSAGSGAPDAGSQTAADPVTPVRKEI